jgi:cobalt-zinc-cadmium resistance protein CzcA
MVCNRRLVLLALIALLVPRLNLDAFPDVTNVQVTANTEAPRLAAEEVEQLITFPVEAVMYALPDVSQVRSISETDLSIVIAVFTEGNDLYSAHQLVFERVQDAKEQNTTGVDTPEMGPNTSGLGQVFQYILRTDDSERFDAMALRSLNDWVVKLLLMSVDGITEVLSFDCCSASPRLRAFDDRLQFVGYRTIAISGCLQMRTDRNRSALPITETELKLMAAAAIIGDNSRPNHG